MRVDQITQWPKDYCMQMVLQMEGAHSRFLGSEVLQDLLRWSILNRRTLTIIRCSLMCLGTHLFECNLQDIALEQLDIKIEFIHYELKVRIYMRQPEGFDIPCKEDKHFYRCVYFKRLERWVFDLSVGVCR